MLQQSIALASAGARGCAAFSAAEYALWVGTTGGEVVRCRLVDRSVTTRGQGYVDLVAVVPGADGLALYLVERGGAILEVARTSAGRDHARVVTDLGVELAGAVLDPTGGSLLVLGSGADAELIRVDLDTGTPTTLAPHLASPAALDALDATRTLVLRDGALAVVDLTTGQVDDVAAVSGTATVALADAATVVVADGPNGTLSSIDIATGTITTGPDVGAEVLALTRWGSLLLAVTPAGVEAIEWGLDEGVLPLRVPLTPAFLGGFVRVEVDVATGGLADPAITAGNVVVTVDEGQEAGTVSAGIEAPGPGGEQRLRVVAGRRAGEYGLTARRRDTGDVVGRARFRVGEFWPGDLDGPPMAVTGVHTMVLMGGGPIGPQNVRTQPLRDVWRVLVVGVDTQDQRMPGVATVESDYRQYLMGDGLPGTQSVRRFMREASMVDTPPGAVKGTDLDFTFNRAFGPLPLGAWADSFEYFRPKDSDTWAGWGPTEAAKTAIPQAFVDQIVDTVDDPGAVLRGIDAFVFVVQTATEDRYTVGKDQFRAKWIWPQTWTPPVKIGWKVTNKDGSSTFTTMPMPGAIYMPSHLPAKMPVGSGLKPLDRVATMCHEMGHTFGCLDLYDTGDWNAGVAGRTAGGVDIMAGGGGLAHFSIANMLRFGWLDPSWVQAFDFSKNPNGGLVLLQSMETLARSGPRVGRQAGIEVRKRDGRNYYVEHRRTQAGQMGDQNLAAAFGSSQVVVTTDVVSTRDPAEPARPDILLVPNDADADGPTLTAANTDYAESDVTDRERMYDFRIRYEGPQPGDPDTARVRVVYERANRADLEVRPAPGGGDWKSPDIDIDGPAGRNKVAKGREHTVSVKVKNNGSFAADDVHVAVSWLPFTTSPGTWTALADPARQTVAPGATVTFTTTWTPPAQLKVSDIEVQHFCVSVVVDRYVDPRTPDHDELTVSNNRAQSNFETPDASSGSPSERTIGAVTVTNTLARDATYLAGLEQDHEFFRAYLGNAWVHLAPGETRGIELAYESLAGDPEEGERFDRAFEKITRIPNTLSVSSFLIPDEPSPCHYPQLQFGATLRVRAAHRTVIRDVRLDGEDAHGEVSGLVDDTIVPITAGTVNVVLWLADRPDDFRQVTTTMQADGTFHALAPGDFVRAAHDGAELRGEAFYLGSPGWSSARSGEVRLR